MLNFKFFHSNPLYTGNIYEEMIIQIWKYCNQEHHPFIGYTHSFTVRNQQKLITIVEARYISTDGILCFDYDLTAEQSTYRHVFNIRVQDFETAIQR